MHPPSAYLLPYTSFHVNSKNLVLDNDNMFQVNHEEIFSLHSQLACSRRSDSGELRKRTANVKRRGVWDPTNPYPFSLAVFRGTPQSTERA